MLCPYCSNEMQHGDITADPRGGMYFQPEGVKRSIGDMLCGVGRIMAARGTWGKMMLPADYCHQCKKLIVDTEIAR